MIAFATARYVIAAGSIKLRRMPTKTIAITGVDPEEHETLKQLAEACGRTLSSMARRALDFYVGHVDEVERELWREAAERRAREGSPGG